MLLLFHVFLLKTFKGHIKTDNSFIFKNASFLHGVLACANEKGFQGPSGISVSSSFALKPLKECKKVLPECSLCTLCFSSLTKDFSYKLSKFCCININHKISWI